MKETMTPRQALPSRLRLLLLASLALLLVALAMRLWPGAPAAGTVARAQSEDTAARIARLEAALRLDPDWAPAYADLGLALLQRVRENADASLYARAEAAFDEALRRDPRLVDALIGQGMLALARHDFPAALDWAVRARAVNPYRSAVLGLEVDAYVELGRYDEAVAAAQRMVDQRPDIASYSRVAYLRELHGDVPGAIAAMEAAVAAGAPGAEGTRWALAQLGDLHLRQGAPDEAEQVYLAALRADPTYAFALAGLANAHAARGNFRGAITVYEPLVERLPLPEFAIALGELYEATGQAAAAERQYGLVRALQALNAAAGMDTDLEMALFEADRGADPARAVVMARAAYARRPSIHGADALAWALFRAGDAAAARPYMTEALRLGTEDALLHFHAGWIAAGSGDPDAARRHLERALAINPAFSPLYVPPARAWVEGR